MLPPRIVDLLSLVLLSIPEPVNYSSTPLCQLKRHLITFW